MPYAQATESAPPTYESIEPGRSIQSRVFGFGTVKITCGVSD